MTTEPAAETQPKEQKARRRTERKAVPLTAELPAATAPRSRYESFATGVLIDRAQIKNAPYNPRRIDHDAADRLESELKRGVVQPIIWNRRTGNLVGGHQRITILDNLHQGKPYSVMPSIIDCDEAEEKRLNVALNNPDLMGQYDVPMLESLLRDYKVERPLADIEADFGFSPIALEDMRIAEEVYLPPETSEEVKTILEDEEQVQGIKGTKKEHKRKARLKAEREILRQVAFTLPDTDNMLEVRKAIMRKLGMPEDHPDPFIDSWRLLRALGIEMDEDEAGE